MSWWQCGCGALHELTPATPSLRCDQCRRSFAVVDVGNASTLARVFGTAPDMPDYAPVLVDLGKRK